MNLILAKLFAFFKTKSPKIYAMLIAVISAVWILNGQGVIHLPQSVVDILIAIGLVSGTQTSAIIKKGE